MNTFCFIKEDFGHLCNSECDFVNRGTRATTCYKNDSELTSALQPSFAIQGKCHDEYGDVPGSCLMHAIRGVFRYASTDLHDHVCGHSTYMLMTT